MRTVNNRLYLADVRLPGSVGLAVRVGNVVTKGNALAANTALSHFNTSKIPLQRSVILYKFFVIHKSADVIIAYKLQKSKSFLKKIEKYLYFLTLFNIRGGKSN